MLPYRQFAAALVAVTISTGAAGAQELGPVAEALFKHVDTNRDGVISKNELKAFRGRVFDRQDANRDGFVTLAEIEQQQIRNQQRRLGRLARAAELRAQLPMPSERLAAADQNKDGKISRDEFVNSASDWFDNFTIDGTGLSKAQFAAFLDGKR